MLLDQLRSAHGVDPRSLVLSFYLEPKEGVSWTQCYGLSGSPNHDADADAEINITSHELIEAATDCSR